MWIDSHAHLTSDALYPELPSLMERAKASGLKKIINICTDVSDLERGLQAAIKWPEIHNSASTTPHDVEKEGELFFPIVEKQALNKKLAAIGETGLDYHYAYSPKNIQQDFLIRYLDLAKRCSLPVVIHCREAFADLFSICDAHYKDLPLVLHCFTGTLDEAKGVIERGWMLSLSGIVTFKKSVELQEVAEWVPLDRLFIETDAPYLAPQSKRGKQNEPSYLPEIGEFIAKLKGVDCQTVAKATSENASQFFKCRNT